MSFHQRQQHLHGAAVAKAMCHGWHVPAGAAAEGVRPTHPSAPTLPPAPSPSPASPCHTCGPHGDAGPDGAPLAITAETPRPPPQPRLAHRRKGWRWRCHPHTDRPRSRPPSPAPPGAPRRPCATLVPALCLLRGDSQPQQMGRKEPAPPRSPGWFPLPTVGARAPWHGRWSRFSIRVSSGDRRVHPTSQHPRAHGLSRVPRPMPPVPRSTAAPRREHGPGSRPVPVSWRSRGRKKEQGEREVLTRAARDIAGLGLQLGALAGFPSVPRGHAPPRPGPGPSPAGHRAQAPRGPLLPHAVNCNTAQRRRPTLPAPRGAPASSSSSWHRGVLAITDPLCPGAPWQSRAQSPAPLRVPPAPLAPSSHPSPNPKGPEQAALPLPLPALLQPPFWGPGTGGTCPPAPTHSPAHPHPCRHTGHGRPSHVSHPRELSSPGKGAGTRTAHEHPKGCSSVSCDVLGVMGRGCTPRYGGERAPACFGVQSPQNIPGSDRAARLPLWHPEAPPIPSVPRETNGYHRGQTGRYMAQ